MCVFFVDRMNVLKRKDAFKILPIGHYCLQAACNAGAMFFVFALPNDLSVLKGPRLKAAFNFLYCRHYGRLGRWLAGGLIVLVTFFSAAKCFCEVRKLLIDLLLTSAWMENDKRTNVQIIVSQSGSHLDEQLRGQQQQQLKCLNRTLFKHLKPNSKRHNRPSLYFYNFNWFLLSHIGLTMTGSGGGGAAALHQTV